MLLLQIHLVACCFVAHRMPGRHQRRISMTMQDNAVISKKTFELCMLDDSGMIEECMILREDELPEHFNAEQLERLRTGAEDLFFLNGKRASANIREWRQCLDDDTCEVPNDVLLKAMGPDALKEVAPDSIKDSDTRYHLHFGAGRLGMGLVVPAIAASGIPFAVIQRAKPKWISLFGDAGEATVENQLGVSVNKQARVGGGRLESCLGGCCLALSADTVFGCLLPCLLS